MILVTRSASESVWIGASIEVTVISIHSDMVMLNVSDSRPETSGPRVIAGCMFGLSLDKPHQYVGAGTYVSLQGVHGDRIELGICGPSHVGVCSPAGPWAKRSGLEDIQYPACDRLLEVREKSQVIGEFVAWLRQEQGLVFCKRVEGHMVLDSPQPEDDVIAAAYLPVVLSVEQLLYEFFGIDRDAVDREKLAIVEKLKAEVAAVKGAGSDDFRGRLRQEKLELSQRLVRLETFIATDAEWEALPYRDRVDVREQLKHMRDYLKVLNRRVMSLCDPALGESV